MFHHCCTSLEGAAGQVLWDFGPRASMADIVCLLQTRFGTQLQAERFKAELHARRRALEKSLQQLYQDICRLVTIAYPYAEALLVTHVGKEAFIAALSDGKLQLEAMKRELQDVEAGLSHAIKLDAFEQSLACRGRPTLVDEDDGRVECQPRTLCTVAELSDVRKTAALHEQVVEMQEALV